jgi:hypothetical protein
VAAGKLEAESYFCFVVVDVVSTVGLALAAAAFSLFFLVRCLSEHALQVKLLRLYRRKSSTGLAFRHPVQVCVSPACGLWVAASMVSLLEVDVEYREGRRWCGLGCGRVRASAVVVAGGVMKNGRLAERCKMS